MARYLPPALAPDVTGNPEEHHRDGKGLVAAWVDDPHVREAVAALRRRGAVVHVEHRPVPQWDRWHNRDRTIPSICVQLQLPPAVPHYMALPAFRTAAGEGGMFSPSADDWTRVHGDPVAWRRLVARAPAEPWDPARRWCEVHLEVTDPVSWLAQLVTRIDDELAAQSPQLALEIE